MTATQTRETTRTVEAVEPAAAAQVYEGTAEEIMALLQSNTFAGQRLKLLVITPEEEDLSATLPDPPNTIRDRAHLEQLLLEGLNSPKSPVTEESWERIRQEVHRRYEARRQQEQS